MAVSCTALEHQRGITPASASLRLQAAGLLGIAWCGLSQCRGMAAFVAHDPAASIGCLANGVRFVVYDHPRPMGRALIHVGVAVGSIHETDEQRGMAHMLEHCVFLGTKSFLRTEDVRAEFTALGASAFEGDSNAFTDFSDTVYVLEFPCRADVSGGPESGCSSALDAPERPAFLAEKMHRALRVLKEIVLEPLLSEEGERGDDGGPGSVSQGIETERAAVLSEAAMRNSVEWRIQQAATGLAHSETMLPRRFPIGVEAQIRGWTARNLREFHSKWYRPEHLTVRVVGDVCRESVLQAIVQVFGTRPRSALGKVDPKHIPGLADVVDRVDAGEKDLAGKAWVCGALPRRWTSSSAIAEAGGRCGFDLVIAPEPSSEVAVVKPSLERYVELPASSTLSSTCPVLLAPIARPGPCVPSLNAAELDVLGPAPECGEHSFDAAATCPVSIFRSSLLTHCAITLSCKVPLATERFLTREEADGALLDGVVSSLFDARSERIRLSAPEPPFVSASLSSGASSGEGCAYCDLDVVCVQASELEGHELGAYSAATKATDAWRGAGGLRASQVAAQALAKPRAAGLRPWRRWQASLAAGVRECVRLIAHGPELGELGGALLSTARSLRDAAAQQDEDDAGEVMSGIEESVATMSAIVSPAQGFALARPWLASAAAEPTVAAREVQERCALRFGFVLRAAEAARSFLQAEGIMCCDGGSQSDAALGDGARGGAQAAPPSGSASEPAGSLEARAATALGSMGEAVTILVAAPGDDSLSRHVWTDDTVSANDGPTPGCAEGDAACGAEAQSTLLSGLAARATGRRARLLEFADAADEEDQSASADTAEWDIPITCLEVLQALAAGLESVAAMSDQAMPDALLTDEALDAGAADFGAAMAKALRLEGDGGGPVVPSFPPAWLDMSSAVGTRLFGGKRAGEGAASLPLPPATSPIPEASHRVLNHSGGYALQRLSNGITVVMRPSKLQPNCCSVVASVQGGSSVEGPDGWQVRASESLPSGHWRPSRGSSELAMRVLSASGGCGLERKDVISACQAWGLSTSAWVSEESWHFAVTMDSAAMSGGSSSGTPWGSLLSLVQEASTADDSATHGEASPTPAPSSPSSLGCASAPLGASDRQAAVRTDASPTGETGAGSGPVARSSLQRALEVIAFSLNHTRPELAALVRERREVVLELRRGAMDVDRAAFFSLMSSALLDDDRLVSATARHAASVSMRDVAAAISRSWDPRAVTITLAGDFDLEQAESACVRFLGSITPASMANVALAALQDGAAQGDSACMAALVALPAASPAALLDAANREMCRCVAASQPGSSSVAGQPAAPLGSNPRRPLRATTLAALPMDRLRPPTATVARCGGASFHPLLSMAAHVSGTCVVVPDPEARASMQLLLATAPWFDDTLWSQAAEALQSDGGGNALTTWSEFRPEAWEGLAGHARASHFMHAQRCARIGTAALSNRLYRRLREELGLVYAVGAAPTTLVAYRGDGFMTVSLTPRPEHAAAALGATLEVLCDLASGRRPLSESEVAEVMEPQRHGLRSRAATDGYWLASAGGWVERGVPLLPSAAADALAATAALDAATIDAELRRQLCSASNAAPGQAGRASAAQAGAEPAAASPALTIHAAVSYAGAPDTQDPTELWGATVDGARAWLDEHGSRDGASAWTQGHPRAMGTAMALVAAGIAVWSSLP